MGKAFRSLLSSILLVICSSTGFSKDFSNDIDSYIRERTNPAKFSGDVLVAQHGKIIFHKSYGMADYENDVPNSTDTLFRIGSLTKPITSAAILVLKNQSGLDINDSIGKYIAKIPDEWKAVQIHHLLSHCSGIPDLFGDLEEVAVEDTAKEIDRVIQSTKNRSLRFEPGTKYEYSNFNYCLLGYILEKVSGQTYPSYLKKSIFHPSGMEQTFYDDPRPVLKRRAEGYITRDGQLYNDKLTDPAGYAAGGLLSSAQDLFRFDQALHSGKLFAPEDLSMMFTPVKENYGYGWQITKQFHRTAFCHRGGTHGFSSYIVRFPDEDGLFIAVLSNVEEQNTKAVACDVAAFMLEPSWIRAFQIIPTDPESLRPYTGDFRLPSGEIRTIGIKEGFLYYQSGDTEYRLRPVASDEFIFERAEEIRLKFVQNPDGSVEMIRSSCGQEEMRGKK